MTKIDMPEFTKPLISLAFLNAMLFCKAINDLVFKHAISQHIDIQQLAMGWLWQKFSTFGIWSLPVSA
jgi:hypothetical protein